MDDVQDPDQTVVVQERLREGCRHRGVGEDRRQGLLPAAVVFDDAPLPAGRHQADQPLAERDGTPWHRVEGPPNPDPGA